MRLALVLYIPIVIVLPFVSWITPYPTLMWGVILSLMAVLYIDYSWSFGEVNVLINNAARSDCLGTVNGIGTALAACARVFGPVLGTSVCVECQCGLALSLQLYDGLPFLHPR